MAGVEEATRAGMTRPFLSFDTKEHVQFGTKLKLSANSPSANSDRPKLSANSN